MPEIQRVKYTHDAMIDLIISNPWISQGEVAEHFGYTQSWVSIVFNSDAFRARLAERKEAIVDPALRATLEERIRGVVDLSLQVIQDKLRATGNLNAAVRVLEHGSRALGYGATNRSVPVQVNTYVAVVPPKARTSAEWLQQYAPQRAIEQDTSAPGPLSSVTIEVPEHAPAAD